MYIRTADLLLISATDVTRKRAQKVFFACITKAGLIGHDAHTVANTFAGFTWSVTIAWNSRGGAHGDRLRRVAFCIEITVGFSYKERLQLIHAKIDIKIELHRILTRNKMAEYSKNLLQSVLDTKSALLSGLELVKEIEELGPIEELDFEKIKPLLAKYGKYAEPDRVETNQGGQYYSSKHGEYTEKEQDYGDALHVWKWNAREAKLMSRQ